MASVLEDAEKFMNDPRSMGTFQGFALIQRLVQELRVTKELMAEQFMQLQNEEIKNAELKREMKAK